MASKMQEHVQTLLFVYSKFSSYALTISFAVIISILLLGHMDILITLGNYGLALGLFHIIAELLISLLLGVVLTLLYTKIMMTDRVQKTTSAWATLGAFFSVLVTGCPSCSITLASYIGLAAVFSALPFFGLEIKVLGILLLFYSVWQLTKPFSCKVED